MLVIGIVGGIASGKSEVTSILGELGARIINADQIGHEVLQDKDTILLIQDAWGDRVLDECGNVNRRELAGIVFQDDHSALEKLEQITHPKIEKRLQQLIREIPADVPAVIIDAPVMIKAGWDRHCDFLVFVDCPLSIRAERAKARGWSASMLEAREAAQAPISEKELRSRYRVDNSASKPQLRQQLIELWKQWKLPLPMNHD